jgi:hypothetical protein
MQLLAVLYCTAFHSADKLKKRRLYIPGGRIQGGETNTIKRSRSNYPRFLTGNFVIIMFIHTKKRKYSADMSLQERRQEKNMVNWWLKKEIRLTVLHQALPRGK